MYSQIKAIVLRSQETLVADVAGAMALMIILLVGLHLPGFV